MAYKVLQLRRDTAANWTSNDPTLAAGEIGVETDTLKFKIGDGSTTWVALAYAAVTPGSLQEEVEDIVGSMATDTSTVDFTYTDGDGTLEADIKISASPGDVTITAEADGLKADISSIDLGASA